MSAPSPNPYATPHALETDPADHGGGRIRPLEVVCCLVAALLLVFAWHIAHRPLGPSFVLAGAIPWFAQWLACALVLELVIRRRGNFSWAATHLAVALPLLTGLLWWWGLASSFWGLSPADALTDALALDTRLALGAETELEWLLHRFIGPLVRPLRLSGPMTMLYLDFIWAGVSTAIVMAYWLWASRWVGDRSHGRRPLTRRELVRSLLAVLIYLLPVSLSLISTTLSHL